MRQVRAYVAIGAVLLVVLAACSGTVKQAPPAPPKTADAAAKAVIDGLQQNKPVALWDALPASYQKDVNDVVHTAVGKADPALWNAGWELFGKLVTLAKTKKDMILKTPAMVDPNAPVKTADLSKNWDAIVGLLDSLAQCDMKNFEKAKTMDMGVFFSKTGAELMAKLQVISQMFPPEKMQDNPWVMLKTFKITPVKAEGDTATVKVEFGGKPAIDEQFVRMEGKWIPMKLAAFWNDVMAKAKKEVTEMPKADPKTNEKMLGVIKAVNNGLTTMIDAKTQDEFNVGLGQALASFALLVPGGDEGPGAPMPKK